VTPAGTNAPTGLSESPRSAYRRIKEPLSTTRTAARRYSHLLFTSQVATDTHFIELCKASRVLTRLLTFAAGIFLIGLAVVAWRLRHSTMEGYQAAWRAMGGDRRTESRLARAYAASGAYVIVFISAAIGITLLVRAVIG